MSLTAKQRRFIDEYLIDLNATQAAIRAGYSEKTAEAAGSRLFRNVKVAAAIAKAMEERSERTKIDADWVLLRIAEMLDADISDIIDEDNTYKPIHEWPKVWRQMLAGVDVQELFEGRGKARQKIGEVVKIRFIDRLKALEMAGKHVDVQAFKERSQVDPGDGWIEVLERAQNSPLNNPQSRIANGANKP